MTEDHEDARVRRVAEQDAVVPLAPPPGRWEEIRAEAHRRTQRRRTVILSAAAGLLLVAVVGVAALAVTEVERGPDRLAVEPTPSATTATPAPPSPTPTPAPPPPVTPSPGTSPPASQTPPSVSPSVPPKATEPPLARCTTAQLEVEAGQVQAAASTRSLVLGLTNVSDTRCTITGFGGLALLDAGGTQLTTRFERSATQPRTVELAPQGFTTRTISWRVVPAQNTDPNADCVSGDALLVTPPDEEPADLVVNQPITACQGGTITGTPWDRDAG